MGDVPNHFYLYKDKAGEWRWHLRTGNGNIIADSGEGYTTKANAVKGARLVAGVATGARMWDAEAKKYDD